MSGIVSTIAKSAASFLINKARDVTANRLSDGDLMDEKFRGMIVRDIEDIKSKLDAMSKKDLLSSLSFFKEGINGLSMAVKDLPTRVPTMKSGKNIGENVVKELVANAGASISQLTIDENLNEASTPEKFEVVSEERWKSAKKSFRKSREKATDAFNNKVLTVEDRVMASKLRIASRILEKLDDPDAASTDCLLYLEELQNLSAVREIFSVEAKGGFKSLFSKAKRRDLIESVTGINKLLLDFMIKCMTTSVNPITWPKMQFRSEVSEADKVLLVNENELLYHVKRKEEDRIKAKWPDMAIKENVTYITGRITSVSSTGEIFFSGNSMFLDVIELYVALASGYAYKFCGRTKELCIYEKLFACFDVEDNAYVLESGSGVSVFDKEEKFEREIRTKWYVKRDNPRILVVDNNIVWQEKGEVHIFKCDGDGKISFSLPATEDPSFGANMCCSDKNEIYIARSNDTGVYVYSSDGQLKQIIPLPTTDNDKKLAISGVGFDAINKEVLVLVGLKIDRLCQSHLFRYRLLVYSASGNLRDSFDLTHSSKLALLSHPKGVVVIVGMEFRMFLHELV